MKILITGIAGFIGFHLAQLLLKKKFDVIGIDNLNHYYDFNLKLSRLNLLKELNIPSYKIDITNIAALKDFFYKEKPDYVINLAAQAGVRYSLDNPSPYIDSNIVGFFNILEICKEIKIKRLIFASSSSVYGNSLQDKFSEDSKADNPLNIYAASKKSNELMAYSYSSLYDLPCVGLRFFTVYGPWGRPDMAYFKFTKNIIEDISIDVYGNGDMFRDFTYIDDITDGIFKLIKVSNNDLFREEKLIARKKVPYEIFNIGNDNPVSLNYFISIIEKHLDKKAGKNLFDMQPGDVKRTSADITKIKSVVDFIPKVRIEEGIPEFIKWYNNYFQSN